MFLFTRVRNGIATTPDADAADAPPSWNSPVTYDSTLVERLIAKHDALDACVAVLPSAFDDHPAQAGEAVRDCATTLHELRQLEALRLHPLIARGISSDPIARRLFWQSRIMMLGLERRVTRRLEELSRAIEFGNGVDVAAAHVASSLAGYRRHNESSMYPLYDAIGQRAVQTPARVA